jgi:hypothetical protein
VAATQGALPEPVQAVAHQALGAVGISVPDIHDGPVDPAGHDDPAVPNGEPKVSVPPSSSADAGVRSSTPRPALAPTAPGPGATGPSSTAPVGSEPGADDPGDADTSEPTPEVSPPSVVPDDPAGKGDGDESPGDTGDGGAEEGDLDSDGDPPVDTVTPDPELPSLDQEATPPGLGGVPPGQAKKAM